jgi:hypothetical protein
MRFLPRFEPFVFYSRNCDGFYRWVTEKLDVHVYDIQRNQLQDGMRSGKWRERWLFDSNAKSLLDGSAYRTKGGGTEWTTIVRLSRLRVRP